jgi:hypothetical protein
MIDDAGPYRWPRTDASALTQTGISHNASFDGAIAFRYRMVTKHLGNEVDFRPPFHLDRQARHRY